MHAQKATRLDISTSRAEGERADEGAHGAQERGLARAQRDVLERGSDQGTEKGPSARSPSTLTRRDLPSALALRHAQ
jgi:hypothetical protein